MLTVEAVNSNFVCVCPYAPATCEYLQLARCYLNKASGDSWRGDFSVINSGADGLQLPFTKGINS